MTPQSNADSFYAGTATEIGLNVQNASPPTQFYVGKDDSLWVGAAGQNGGLVVTLNARYLMPDGNIKLSQYTLRYSQSRAMQYQQINLPECFLLSVAATCNITGGSVGSAYVQVVISRFAPTLFNSAQVLCQGYCLSNQPVSWPGGTNSTSVDAAGAPLIVAASAPAAGAELSLTVPSNARWQVLSLRYTLLTSVTVATRFSQLFLDDGLNVFAALPVSSSQVASLGCSYTWAPGMAILNNSPTPIESPLPNLTVLMPGYRVRTNTSSIQVGDQYSAMTALVLEWLLP